MENVLLNYSPFFFFLLSIFKERIAVLSVESNGSYTWEPWQSPYPENSLWECHLVMVLDGLLIMLCLGLELVSSVFYFRSWKKDIFLYYTKYLSAESFLEVRELLWYFEMEAHLFRCAFAMWSLSRFQMVVHQGQRACQRRTSASKT